MSGLLDVGMRNADFETGPFRSLFIGDQVVEIANRLRRSSQFRFRNAECGLDRIVDVVQSSQESAVSRRRNRTDETKNKKL